MIQDKDINRHKKPRETLFFYDNGSQLHSKSLFIDGISHVRDFYCL